MKLNPTPGPINTRAANTMISTQASGTTSGQVFTTNFRSKSQLYQPMNQRIILIDNAYKGLTSLQQTAWSTEAGGYTGIPLCGCKGKNLTGQTLYRSCNYALLSIDQPITNTPVPYAGTGPGLEISVVNFTELDTITFYAIDVPLAIIFILQLGQGLGNPSFLWLSPGNPITIDPTNQYYEILSQQQNATSCDACMWTTDAAPMFTGTCGFTVF